MIVDLGLPDGSGLDLIAEMHRARPRIGVLFGLSGDAAAARDVIAAGADGFLAKPLDSLAAFQREILARLPEERHPAGPRPIDDAPIRPDPLALWQDLRQAEALLQDGEVATLRYAAQFLGSLARATAEAELAAVADDVIAQGAMGAPARARLRGVAGAMRQRIDRAAGP
jgi:DNA-binding response OmpR family regulator